MKLKTVSIDDIQDAPAARSKARQRSLLALGQRFPAKVRLVNGYYEIVDGRRRVQDAQAAGLEEVLVVVEEMDEDQAAMDALVANLSRSPNPMNEAHLLGRLTDKGYTQEQLARALGVSQGLISQRLALLDLIPALQSKLKRGEMTLSAARAARKLPSADQERLVGLDRVTVGAAQGALRSYQSEMVDLSTLDVPEGPGDNHRPSVVLSGDEMERLTSGEAVTVSWQGQEITIITV